MTEWQTQRGPWLRIEWLRRRRTTTPPPLARRGGLSALYGALDGAIAVLGAVVFATTCLNVAGYGVVVEDGGLLFGTLPELRMRATLAGD